MFGGANGGMVRTPSWEASRPAATARRRQPSTKPAPNHLAHCRMQALRSS